MLGRLAVLAFLVALVTCGSRTQTPDDDPNGQAGTPQGVGGAGVTVTGGSTTVGVGGSTGTGTFCGGGGDGLVCPPGSACCAGCGICVSPDVPCPDCFPGGAGGGFPGTGGAFNPGTGGTTFPGAGGFSMGTGGAAGCGPVGECQARLQTSCPPNDACTCNTCSCQARACYNDKGCLLIYNCMSATNCTDPGDCFNKCGAIIMGAPGTSFPLAMNLQQCAQGSGCVRCARPAFDAGTAFCSTPPPPTGGVTCSVSGPGGVTCSQACGDGSHKYYSECANGGCSCNYDGKEICRCSYAPQSGCYSCCPPWVGFAL